MGGKKSQQFQRPPAELAETRKFPESNYEFCFTAKHKYGKNEIHFVRFKKALQKSLRAKKKK